MRRQTFGEMCRYVLALVVLCHAVSASRRVKTSSDWPSTSGTKNEHKFSLSSPELNDEEGHSQHMPAHLRCDACRAIAYQMQEFLQKVSNKLGNNLPESQLVDTLDSCCSQSWEEYGVKEVGGELRLSGPGLETKNSFGMLMGGGKWPFRKTFIDGCLERPETTLKDHHYARLEMPPSSSKDSRCLLRIHMPTG
uniref:marginal zone B- and B1-cell-specific protein-like isoform X2 n=1 Tax=Myxine glutinosa TaxID=7769 RepID=UPI00358FBB09